MSVVQRPPKSLGEAAAHSATRPRVAPQRLHHLAYVTRDTEATAAFYTGVLGLPLVNAVIDDHVPSTKEALPFIHSFFRLGTGETIAFFESPTLPPPAPRTHAVYRTFEHLALEVPTREDVEVWHAWLIENGIEVIANDHGSIYSIYFHDPVNDIRLEITASIAANWNAKEASARVAFDDWTRTKCEARDAGKDMTTALSELAATRSRSRRA
jgi:catechol 2,3-dioxygenase-like lactoylglutathione lyase family enzyme